MLKLRVLIRATESLKVRVSVRIRVKVSVMGSLKIRVSGFCRCYGLRVSSFSRRVSGVHLGASVSG